MYIKEVKNNKKMYLDLLLIADESIQMIDKYIERGTLYILEDNGLKGACVVTDEGNGVLEIKNIAVKPDYQKMGYGKALIKFIEKTYSCNYNVLQVGTGDSPLTIPFYEKCGFKKSHIVKNFFTKNYPQPIFENGVQLIDMIYLQKNINV